MTPITITIKPTEGPIVSLELEGLHEYYLVQGDEGMLHMIAALEALTSHLKYGTRLYPTVEVLQ